MGARKPFSGFQTITATECCLIKLFPYILFDKYFLYFRIESGQPRETTTALIITAHFRSLFHSLKIHLRASPSHHRMLASHRNDIYSGHLLNQYYRVVRQWIMIFNNVF